MSVGLSWISLDSLVRIKTYQWVTRHQASKSFSRRFFRGIEAREGEHAVLGVEAQKYSWGKLNSISDFLQLIVARAVRLGRLNPKAVSPQNNEVRLACGCAEGGKLAAV
jgi:hypothetical protein